tara:strand:- start:586 stop:810 length:225 start_codon:yes stop_codon:yes gene_type:complete
LPANTPVLLIENASLPEERRFSTPLLGLSTKSALEDGPAMMPIGEAVRHHRVAGYSGFSYMVPPPISAAFCPGS